MVNKQYKDRVFRLVFNDKRSLLELYNALNNSHYDDPGLLEITTLEDAVYMSMKNDLSFLIDHVLNLYEHQSTFNPNMPLRGLFYLSDIYRRYVACHKLNLYGSRLCTLPIPNYLVFYNGTKSAPDRTVLKLSDAFPCKTDVRPCMEVEAVMLNINMGHNLEIMERCKRLRDYACFVERVRLEIGTHRTLETAVSRAVNNCIRDGILAEFLSAHKAEVLDMVLYDYNEQEHIEMEREEAKEEGFEEGFDEGLEKGVSKGLKDALEELLSGFGPLPAQIRERIERETSSAALREWIRLSARAESVEEFVEKAGISAAP